MPLAQQLVMYVGKVTFLALLAGLLARRRYRVCRTFLVYVAAVFLSSVLIQFSPGRFNNWDFWLAKETLFSALKLAVALELGWRAFQRFPGAIATARRSVLFVLSVTFVSVLVAQPQPNLGVLVGEIQPRILNGTIWLFTAIAGTILWYRIPVDAFHKAILVGFVPYLVVFSLLLRLITSWGWVAAPLGGLLDSLAYVALCVYWAQAAWRQAPEVVALPERAPVLQTG